MLVIAGRAALVCGRQDCGKMDAMKERRCAMATSNNLKEWNMENPSPQIVDQRVRNRIIEMLEWLVECETTPPDCGMDELINGWEDWVPAPFEPGLYLPPVFTEAEQELICRVSRAVDVFCDATPKSITDARAAIQLPQWAAVIAAARSALLVMLERGRMPEENALR
ncbi:MAG: hypothetical protein LBP52_07820 [Burkholderiaceae bacterium]|nr:hypothetical protein [Burkholderiaceae bacterium]